MAEAWIVGAVLSLCGAVFAAQGGRPVIAAALSIAATYCLIRGGMAQ